MNPDNPFSSGPGKAAPKKAEPKQDVVPTEPAVIPEPEAKEEESQPVAPVLASNPVRPIAASASGDLPPLEMDETSCRTCQFCHFEGDLRVEAVEGECRYNAPRPGQDERATWPIVDWNSWCGQWNSGISNDDMVKMARVVADSMTDRGSFIE